MCRFWFYKIMQNVCAHDSYFLHKLDACRVVNLSPVQKCTITMKMLAFALVVDAYDECCKIKKRKTIECLKQFVKVL